jgi:hypothetical protein
MIFCDSNIAFYCAGNIGYRWAVKVMAAIAENDLGVTSDSLMCLEVVDQYCAADDFEGAHTQLRALRAIFPDLKEVTCGDFERSAELFSENPEASARLLLRFAVMERFGTNRLIATFSANCETIRRLERHNLMARLEQ